MTERALQKKGFPAENLSPKRSSSGGRAWEDDFGDQGWPQDAKRSSSGGRSWGPEFGDSDGDRGAEGPNTLRRPFSNDGEPNPQRPAVPDDIGSLMRSRGNLFRLHSEEQEQDPPVVAKEAVQKSAAPESESEETHVQAKCSECQREDEEKQKQGSVQTQLTVGAPGDKYEQEADSTAAKVMAMPDSAVQPSIQRQTEEGNEGNETVQMQPLANSITPLVQRASGEEDDIQMKAGGQQAANGDSQGNSSIESRLAGSKGGGSPLPDGVRSFMEPRFGADFSGVRVHTDSKAVQMNKEVGGAGVCSWERYLLRGGEISG